MEKDPQLIVIPPSHKAVRGFSSSIDVSDNFILYFNGNTVILRPHLQTTPTLSINHVSDIAAARFSHDGKLIASIDARGTLIISQPLQDRVLTVYQYEGVFPNAKYVDWSADKKKVCVVGQGKNKFARVISIQTGVAAGEIGSVTATLNCCSFRPERPYKLVLAGDEYSLKCYDGPPYSFVKSDKSHTNFINQLKYSPKGSFIVSGGADRKLVLYQGKTYEKLGQKENAHNGSVFGLDWIDDEHFTTVSSDKLLKIWNTKFEELFSIATASEEDMKNPKKIGDFLVGVRSFKDKLYLLTLQGDILVYKNPLITKQSVLIKRLSGCRAKVAKLLQIDQDNLILLDSGGRVLTFNLPQKTATSWKIQNEVALISNGFIKKAQAAMHAFLLAGNGNVLLYALEKTNQFTLINKVEAIQFADIAAGRNHNQFIGTYQNKVAIFDLKANKIVNEINVEQDISCLASNDNYILVGTVKGKLFVYDYDLKNIYKTTLKTFKISAITLIPATSSFHCIFGDTSGSMSCIKIAQNSVQVVKETMGGHSSVITAVDFDTTYLYAFGMDGRVTVWNRQNFTRLREIKDLVNGGIVGGLSFDDYLVVTGSDLMTKIVKKAK